MDGSSWSLQEEVEYSISRWYMLVLVFLIGGVAGWGTGYIVPTDYEARAPLFVAFNADAIFTSPDDYKNAQFEEVTDLILSDEVLDEALTGLDEKDRAAMRERLSVQWRNAGRWELVAQSGVHTRAALLVALWRELAFEQITDALSHAQTFYQLDLELKAVIRMQGETHREQTRLQAVEMAVRDWLAQLEDEPVSAQEREELLALALSVSTPTAFPDEGAARQVYVDWGEDLLVILETEHSLLDTQDQALRERMAALGVDWLAEKTASRGLSAFLVVELRGEVESDVVRAPGVLTLVGGVIGVLGWLGFRLVNVARNSAARQRREDDRENS
jgi:hypothetical protein